MNLHRFFLSDFGCKIMHNNLECKSTSDKTLYVPNTRLIGSAIQQLQVAGKKIVQLLMYQCIEIEHFDYNGGINQLAPC